MNFIFTLLFKLILFKICLSASIDRLSHSDVLQQNESKNILSEDFIFPTFDGYSLEEIIQLEKNPRFSSFVKEIIFPAKFNNYEFRIYICDSPVRVYTSPDDFQMHEYDFIMDLIKKFGKSIQKLSYVYNIHLGSDEQTATVFQTIQEHCSDTLRSLSLKYTKENSLMEFKKPFLNVEEFRYQIPINQTKFILPMNEMFPRLQRLYLNFFYTLEHNEFFESVLPNLENVEISMNTGNTIAMEQLEKLFCKNPHIRILIFNNNYMDNFIQVINNCLPNLEHLSVYTLDSSVESVQLDHVKYFSVVTASNTSPYEKLSMPRLESLSMSYYQRDDGDLWIAFFKNHQNIREISCKAHTDVRLPDFLAELPNLTKIQINSQRNFGIDFVCGLIESQKHLLSLQYEITANDHPEVSDLENYLEEYGNEWHITHCIINNVSTYTFQKKN